MQGSLDRIRSLEASREIMQRRLKETFLTVEKIDKRLGILESTHDSVSEKLERLIEKIDELTDDLILLESETKRLKELSHEHRIIK